MSASAQRIRLMADMRAEAMATATGVEMVEQVSCLSCWSSWKISVSSLTLSSHCFITTLLYRTILSFIFTHSPSQSCKKIKSKAERELTKGGTNLQHNASHILYLFLALFFSSPHNPHRNSHRLSHTFSFKGHQTGRCFDMTEEAVQIILTNC